jgi:hypothetical protein
LNFLLMTDEAQNSDHQTGTGLSGDPSVGASAGQGRDLSSDPIRNFHESENQMASAEQASLPQKLEESDATQVDPAIDAAIKRLEIMQEAIRSAMPDQSQLTNNATRALQRASLEFGQRHHFADANVLRSAGSGDEQKESEHKDSGQQKSKRKKSRLNTFVWGRLLWEANHMLASDYPDAPDQETQEDARRYFTSQVSLMPCQEECAPAWREAMAKHPPQVGSREELMEWLRVRHNEVSALTGGVQMSKYDMLNRVAEQRAALAAVVYYAKPSDYEALERQRKISAFERFQNDFRLVLSDPECIATIMSCCTVALILLILWLWHRKQESD